MNKRQRKKRAKKILSKSTNLFWNEARTEVKSFCDISLDSMREALDIVLKEKPKTNQPYFLIKKEDFGELATRHEEIDIYGTSVIFDKHLPGLGLIDMTNP